MPQVRDVECSKAYISCFQNATPGNHIASFSCNNGLPTQTTPMEKIPTEICEGIFSLLAANQKDVSSCRLVCKEFEEQSRPFLIPRLCFAFRRRSDMQRLARLAALPHLADTVHTLVLDARVYVPEQSRQHDHLAAEFRSILYEWTWLDAVARALPKFKKIRAIETATEPLGQENPERRIRWFASTGLDKIEVMTLGSLEEGLSPTDLIDYNVQSLPNDCARFLSSQKKHPCAAMLCFAFRGLVNLQISLDTKEWEVDEIRRKQPLRPIWQSCQNTLERLTLGLVWRSCDEDPDSAAAAAEDDDVRNEYEDDEDEDDEDDEDDGVGSMIGSPVNEKAPPGALHAVIVAYKCCDFLGT